VPKGSVTAQYAGGNDPYKSLGAFTSHGNGPPLNWHNQGADSALYSNDEIHAVRVLVMEPTTDRRGAVSGRRFFNHAHERLRILGEIPLRTFENGKQPLDPDGNPDTSFLAKIPADTAFTFQTIDKDGMVLNMAQTWHQLRPGEIRTNCGGCHAHSQQPTRFEETRAGKPDARVWDLVNTTPVLVDRKRDESKQTWDTDSASGLKVLKRGPVNVEYHRDIRPILQRHCVQCHSPKNEAGAPAGKLDLDADGEMVQVENEGKFPGTYYRLAQDERAKFGYKPVGWDSWGSQNASRYIRKFQARRSVLVWKIFGKRLDGFDNDNVPSETTPGAGTLSWKGQAVDTQKYRALADLDFVPPQCPPPDGKVPPLSDEDKRTLVRWIDLGCPIDLDFDPANPQAIGNGWMLDDNRPILTLTSPQPGANGSLTRLLVGMHDYYSGLDLKTFRVTADFAIDGAAPGQDLAAKFKATSQGVWELRLGTPIAELPRGTLVVSVRDRQGNVARLERTFSIAKRSSAKSSRP
jgi:mono/diheme cytochrome c family protein